MLLRRSGAPTRRRCSEGRRRGCGRQPRCGISISPSHLPPSPKASPRRGCHRHALSRQEPSQTLALRCPLLSYEGFSRLALAALLDTSLFGVRACGVDAGWRAPSSRRLAVVPAVGSRREVVIDVKAGSEQLLIWLLLFHLLTFWSVMGVFIHLVTLNGIWRGASPGTMKQWCCTEVAQKFPCLFFVSVYRYRERSEENLVVGGNGKFGYLTGSSYRHRCAIC